MYVPQHFRMPGDVVRQFLTDHGAGDLVTMTSKGLLATLLPFIFDASLGPHGALLGHLARNNEQWQRPPLSEALAILRGPDAYVSPGWYASKAEDGRVVPTWNYVTAHVYGELVVHDDARWVEDLVSRLTEKHEARRAEPWSMADAPERFIAGQLRAIVGVELRISRIEAKAKLSQNRSAADRNGVQRGARSNGQAAMAEAVRTARP